MPRVTDVVSLLNKGRYMLCNISPTYFKLTSFEFPWNDIIPTDGIPEILPLNSPKGEEVIYILAHITEIHNKAKRNF
jgi:hypothetical protein